MKKHTIKSLTVAFTLAAILTLTGCPGPVTPDNPCTHENKKNVIETAATCTETGLEKIICADCGELIEENTIEALGHDFGEWDVTTAATCTADGEETRTCKREGCKHFETRTIKAHHSWGDWNVTKEATCTEKGSKKHTCSCSNCGAEETVEIDALGHDWKEIITDKTKAATCTENGIAVYKCKTCRAIEERTVSKLDHDYQGGYCENCGEYKFGNQFIVNVYNSIDEWNKAIINLGATMQSSEPIYDECKFSFETNNIPTNLNELIHLKIKYKGYKVQAFISGGVDYPYTEDIENEGVGLMFITDILLSHN